MFRLKMTAGHISSSVYGVTGSVDTVGIKGIGGDWQAEPTVTTAAATLWTWV